MGAGGGGKEGTEERKTNVPRHIWSAAVKQVAVAAAHEPGSFGDPAADTFSLIAFGPFGCRQRCQMRVDEILGDPARCCPCAAQVVNPQKHRETPPAKGREPGCFRRRFPDPTAQQAQKPFRCLFSNGRITLRGEQDRTVAGDTGFETQPDERSAVAQREILAVLG